MRTFLTNVARYLAPKRPPRSPAGISLCAALGAPEVSRGFLFGKTYGAGDDRPNPPGRQPAVGSPNPLESYFDAHVEGPVIYKWRHYFDIYHRHLAKFIGSGAHVLEVGIYRGGSLGMWQSYFGPRCHIYGVDIDEACKSHEGGAVRVFIGDQADRKFWERFKGEVPVLDVVIDDGGHTPHQQVVTLEELLPHLRPGGLYICEDVHREVSSRRVFNPFTQYVCGLSHNLNDYQQKPGASDLASLPSPFQRAVRSVHLYPYMVVIERSDAPVTEFVAEKHGTW